MPKSLEQLLGGYATDTLTEEEHRQLMEAALHEQALFDALADEEALKALLANQQVRQRILASLEESQQSLWVAPSHPSWFSWFHQPSALAWVGSIAALGLALIFGWQMEKDWGPFVEQDELAKRAQVQDQETNNVVIRPQASQVGSKQETIHDLQMNDQQEPERAAGVASSPVSPRSPLPNTSMSKKSSRVRQPSAQMRAEDLLEGEGQKERWSKTHESASGASVSSISKNVPKTGQRVAASVAAPATEEQDLQDLAQAPSLDVVQEYSERKARGIRYRFVQTVVDGKDETIDIMRFSGKWSKLHVVIESNVSGHLYVLTTFGKGKRQWMRPRSSKVKVMSDGAIKMKGFRPVDFALSQVVNTLGKPVVSSITVLLSSTPITDLGKWLDRGPSLHPSEGNLTEDRLRDHFVINPSLALEVPLRVTISLETGKRSRKVLESLPPSEFFP